MAPLSCLRKRFEFIKICVFMAISFSHFLLICKNSQRRQRISVLQMPKRQDKQKANEKKRNKIKKEQRTQFVKNYFDGLALGNIFVCARMHDLEILF